MSGAWADTSYLIAGVCFILALKGLSAPRTARLGTLIGAAGATLAVIVALTTPHLKHLGLIIAARYGPISIVSPLVGAYPVVTLFYAALVLKERITRLQYAWIGSIVTGILLCSAFAQS